LHDEIVGEHTDDLDLAVFIAGVLQDAFDGDYLACFLEATLEYLSKGAFSDQIHEFYLFCHHAGGGGF
jgi:hypothetical protein